MPVLALAGVAMCLLYERTGSLWPAIAFHFVMNAAVIAVVTGAPVAAIACVGAPSCGTAMGGWPDGGRVTQARSSYPVR